MPSKSRESHSFWLPYGVLAALILIRFLPIAVGTKWLWGVGQLTLLPVSYQLAYGILAAVALILPFLPKAESWGDSVANWFSQTFFESKSKYVSRLVLIVLLGVAFSVFQMPTHFLGDGMTYLSNAASNHGHWVKWSEGGAMMAVMQLRSLLGEPNEQSALKAFQIVSTVSGLVTTWFYFLIAKQISPDPAKRLMTFVVLFFSSSLLLYFGYAESYPIMWGPIVGFLYFSLKYSTEGKGLWAALVCLALALFLHLQAGMFVPAFGFLLLSRGIGQRLYIRFRVVIQLALGLTILVMGVLCYRILSNNLALQDLFLFPFSGKPIYPEYAQFSPRHLSDLLNLFLLVYPVGFVILVVSWKEGWRRILEPTTVYLGLVTVGSLLFLLLIDPGLSMPRDWDLFSSCWIAPMLLLLYLVPDSGLRRLKRLSLLLLLSSVILVLPWLLVNLNQERSIEETKQIINNNPNKSFGTISLLRLWYRTNGDSTRADSVEQERVARYPHFYALRKAWADLQAGNLDLAEKEFHTIPQDKYSRDFHNFLADLAMRRQQYDSALYHAEEQVKLAPYVDVAYSTLSSVHYLRGEPDKAMAALRQGLMLNRESISLTVGLAANFARSGQFDSVLYYSDRAIALNPNLVQAYFFQSQAYTELGDHEKALESAGEFLKRVEPTKDYSGYKKLLLQQFPELDSAMEEGTVSDSSSHQ
jgi:tetratricopeptide (TPR) repeat protein